MIPGEDIGAYLDMLGQAVTVAGVSVRTVFDADYGEAFGVGTSVPAITCATADVSAAVLGTAVTVGATAYTVRAVEPDGQGVTVLKLQKS